MWAVYYREGGYDANGLETKVLRELQRRYRAK